MSDGPQFLRPRWNHYLSGKKYSDGWEATFGKDKKHPDDAKESLKGHWICAISHVNVTNYPDDAVCWYCGKPKPE